VKLVQIEQRIAYCNLWARCRDRQSWDSR